MQIYSDKTSSTSSKPLIIEYKNISVNYGKIEALKDISFKLYKEDFLYIIGPNGAGKSTLVKLLTNTLQPSNGTIHVEHIKKGYLPQIMTDKPNFPITVNEVIYSGFQKQTLLMSKKDKTIISDWLKKMDIPNIGNQLMSTLSGGQKQRIFLIRALIKNPDLLILDEPTSALDPTFRKSFYHLINRLNQNGTTIIFITHDLHEALDANQLVMDLDQKIYFFGYSKDYQYHQGGHHV